jgi:hypothetical protein
MELLISILTLVFILQTSSAHTTSRARIHPDQGHYDFPLSLGAQVTTTTGKCAIGSQVYNNCVVRVHAYGVSIHAADTTLSSIPLIAFQSDSILFPEPTTSPIIVVEPVGARLDDKVDRIRVDSLTVRDLSLPATLGLMDQLMAGRLRVSVNVTKADIKMDEQEYAKLLQTRFIAD